MSKSLSMATYNYTEDVMYTTVINRCTTHVPCELMWALTFEKLDGKFVICLWWTASEFIKNEILNYSAHGQWQKVNAVMYQYIYIPP